MNKKTQAQTQSQKASPTKLNRSKTKIEFLALENYQLREQVKDLQ